MKIDVIGFCAMCTLTKPVQDIVKKRKEKKEESRVW